jgi:hypothetical protein
MFRSYDHLQAGNSGFPSNATQFSKLFSILFNNRYMFRSYEHLQAGNSGFVSNATLLLNKILNNYSKQCCFRRKP